MQAPLLDYLERLPGAGNSWMEACRQREVTQVKKGPGLPSERTDSWVLMIKALSNVLSVVKAGPGKGPEGQTSSRLHRAGGEVILNPGSHLSSLICLTTHPHLPDIPSLLSSPFTRPENSI